MTAHVPDTAVFGHRTRGHTHGPITRLMSPGDLGHHLKPFVFLDAVQMVGASSQGFGWHPHSGIATATVLFEGSLWAEEINGEKHVVPAGGVEWVEAGGGVWHRGGPAEGTARLAGFQLWLALPAGRELRASSAAYVEPNHLPVEGPVRVVLGAHNGLQSPLPSPDGITYLQITLDAGQRVTLTRAPDHVAFVGLLSGALNTTDDTGASEALDGVELGVLARGRTTVTLEATRPTRLVYGAAPLHPHPLVLGTYSVHTSAETLREGELGIVRLREAHRERLTRM